VLIANRVLQGRYRITREIGGGGMSHVFLAEDIRLENRLCVVKMLQANQAVSPAEKRQMEDQFRQEAKLLASLQHPNLPGVVDFFTENGIVYLVMEYIEGTTLAHLLERQPSGLPEALVLAYADQICQALDYLHSRPAPIIFRDLKPDNIMITNRGVVKLIDFGIARVFKTTSQNDTLRMGTVGYAPPEQYRQSGQTDARSDIYALAATMHHALTGRDPSQEPPFSFPPVRQLAGIVSPRTDSAIMKALSYERDERWSNVRQLKRALIESNVAMGRPQVDLAVPQHSQTSQGQAPRKSSRPTTRLLLRAAQLSNGQLAAAVMVLLAAIVAGVWFLTPVLQQVSWYWNNVPTVALVGPLAYAASRKRGVAGATHALVAIIGGALVAQRAGLPIGSSNLIVGGVVSALIIEAFVALLIRQVGERDWDEPGIWQMEVRWLIGMAVVAYIALAWITLGASPALNLLAWVSAAVLAAVGWFLGDLVQGYLYLQQTGLQWRGTWERS
jgi:serine/threonine protein kinase